METPGLDLYQDDPLLPTLILLTVCLRIVPRFSLAVFFVSPIGSHGRGAEWLLPMPATWSYFIFVTL